MTTQSTSARGALGSRSDAPVLIAGGGIGGLSAAIALARRGIASVVLERRAGASEEGAGIQIGPNGTRILADLGVAEHLAPAVGVPDALVVRSGASGARIVELPLGLEIAARHGAPYWVAHRADLHASLEAVARASAKVAIEPGVEAIAYRCGEDGVEVETRPGRRIAGRCLIGADGLWSNVRREVFGRAEPRFAGACAARAVVDSALIPADLRGNRSGIWLMPGAHVVHYPVRAGRETAVVVIYPGGRQAEGWASPLAADLVRKALGRVAPALAALIDAVGTWRSWSLNALAVPPALSRGRVALLGDAAHPTMPFLAQGGVLALEDAVVLARELALTPHDDAGALARYAAARRPRAVDVVDAATRNGRIYHLSGAAAAARDLVLRLTPPSRTMARYDWVYGWRAEA